MERSRANSSALLDALFLLVPLQFSKRPPPIISVSLGTNQPSDFRTFFLSFCRRELLPMLQVRGSERNVSLMDPLACKPWDRGGYPVYTCTVNRIHLIKCQGVDQSVWTATVISAQCHKMTNGKVRLPGTWCLRDTQGSC